MRRATALLATALGALALAAPAHAALPGPASMSLGLTDYAMFADAPAPVQALWLSRAQSIGSSYVRLIAWWSNIAPARRPRGFKASNPRAHAYRWASLDETVRAAAAHGQNVILTANGAPIWAEEGPIPAGVVPGIWFPNAADFGAFAHALAERYSGHFPDPLHRGRALPRVRFFQAWNEPNLPNYLMPQWGRAKNGSWVPVSPGIYRSMLNSFYAGVKSVSRSDLVLSAGTGPYGDPPATGYGRMYPVTFLQGLFCLTAGYRPAACPNPVHVDAVDDHPYSVGPTVKAQNPGDISVPDQGKIWRILRTAARYRRVLPRGPKSIWITEIDWTSGPPSTPALQAHNLAVAMYEFWRQNVSHVSWYEIRDAPPAQKNSFLTAGLYTNAGIAKAAAAAYRFPFAVVSLPHKKMALWGRAPTTGTASVQEVVHGRWRQIASLRTTYGGIFYAEVKRIRGNHRLRSVINGISSPVFVTD